MNNQKEWYECLKREARIKLIMLYGIKQPTEKDVNLYIIYGEKMFETRRNNK